MRLVRIALCLLAAGCTPAPAPVRRPPPTPPASQSAPPPAAVPDAGAPAHGIGTAHPVTLLGASPSRRWVALCQAREDTDRDGRIAVTVGAHGKLMGDRLSAELAFPNGTSLPIDDVLAWESSGRWLVVLAAGTATLVDAETASRVVLAADLRYDARAFRNHRSFAFDEHGRTLAYLDNRGLPKVRTLASGAESTGALPPGDVWRLEMDGRWLVQHLVTSRWPTVQTPPSPCVGPVPSYPSAGEEVSGVTTAVAPLDGGPATLVPGFVTALDAGFVVRETDDRLVLQQPDGLVELAPAKCGARVLHRDAQRNLLVIACSGEKGRPPLQLVGPGLRQELGVDVAFLGHDRLTAGTPRVVPLYPGNAAALLDLEKRKLIQLEAGDRVVATSGPRALVQRGRQLRVHDVDSAVGIALAGKTDLFAEPLSAGSIGVVAPLVADALRARLLGQVAGAPLAAAHDGSVLVAAGGDATAHELAKGPLEWRSPQPLTETAR